jgi:hypothetical protein
LKTIVYLHGFISSPRSKKAVMLGDYLRNVATGVDYVVPEMHHRPRAPWPMPRPPAPAPVSTSRWSAAPWAAFATVLATMAAAPRS